MQPSSAQVPSQPWNKDKHEKATSTFLLLDMVKKYSSIKAVSLHFALSNYSVCHSNNSIDSKIVSGFSYLEHVVHNAI